MSSNPDAPPLTTTSADTITTDSASLLNVDMTHVTKLSANSYLMRNWQVYALLYGYRLALYLDGAPPLESYLTVNNASVINPALTEWTRQDRLIYSALLSAISILVQPLVSRANMAANEWQKLAVTYVKPIRDILNN